ncbi:MAG TPA: transglutaminase family protein [Burkholderiales bacterium]|nr:transglutaminase family protein [Betaproteobacteria bacterium]HQR52575.1 transglutaminase family protein [Burkholderiales bacterium]
MNTFDIHCELGYEVGGPSTFLLNLEVAAVPGQRIVHESLVTEPALTLDRYTDPILQNRFVRFNADAGTVRLDYRATVEVEGASEGVPDAFEVPVGELPLEVLRFILPSRYCESDALMRMATQDFGTLAPGAQRVEAICQWIRDHIKYEIGTTQGTHSAFDTVTGRAGVCRDFAHLGIAFCRALNIPARFVTGYAMFSDPPPDFHAVFEAYLSGGWYLFDPTGLAKRSEQVRIGTGRDAADVAFATIFGSVRMTYMSPLIGPAGTPLEGQPIVAAA